MASRKCTSFRVVLLHSAVYALCMGAAMFAGLTFSRNVLLMWLFCSFTHAAIDSTKKLFRVKPFIVDQLLHLSMIAVALLLWGGGALARPFVQFRLPLLGGVPAKPLILLISCTLWLLKPVGFLIGIGEIWNFNRENSPSGELQSAAGMVVGCVERLIMFIFLIHGQFTASALVVFAKAILRLADVRKSKNGENGEKTAISSNYFIGTALSVACTLIITLLFGLLES